MSIEMISRIAANPRQLRVLTIMAGIWVLHSFDLSFTLGETVRGNFQELNPVAAQVVHVPPFVIAYKVALLGGGSAILIWLRKNWQAELGCWLLLLCSVGTLAWWSIYYRYVEICLSDPAVNAASFGF